MPSNSRSIALLVVSIFFHRRIRPDINTIGSSCTVQCTLIRMHKSQYMLGKYTLVVLPLSNEHLIVWPLESNLDHLAMGIHDSI